MSRSNKKHEIVYSNKEKFAWIQLGKVGSCSIFKVLSENTKLEHRKTNSETRRSLFEFNVDLNFLKKINNTYFTFIFVRNPWDRLVSYYKSSFQCETGYFSKKYQISNPSEIEFSHFIKLVTDKENLNLNKHWRPQSRICDLCKLDFIGRFENIQEDFNIVCDKIGIPQQQLPHTNKSKHKRKHYTEYYDDETREIVAEKYAKDIEYFGYEFED
tara:strand:- start:3500 stop:4141 length:642 start_codon:yes stop_codon:yes gene_type:complete